MHNMYKQSELYRNTKPRKIASQFTVWFVCLYHNLSERKRSVSPKSFDIDTKTEETLMADLTNQPGVTK